ncbi:LOW QUALITY PROTEIN: hypothetical protein PanWU01x14_150550 [Parasponia andersonii]|uniref:Uncharacterized protein n=1 Tax=Parasponia andersonii TaxID=3476 RepID=A0A2P5CI99_PARAD|nr:LOW QUALITY PROTEIN: hypothetical protein PanWU01x14_150550 [Parasponia andersonii]
MGLHQVGTILLCIDPTFEVVRGAAAPGAWYVRTPSMTFTSSTSWTTFTRNHLSWMSTTSTGVRYYVNEPL